MEQGSLVVGRMEPGARISIDGAEVSVSSDGLFAFGIEFDRTRAVELLARYADGTSEARSVMPSVRHYEVQRINGLPEAYVTPTAEVAERIKREHGQVTEARMRDTGAM